MRLTRTETASFVISSIRALGFQLHAQSRLMRMHDVYVRTSGIISPHELDFETALEAERDMQVLAFVFDTGVASHNDTAFKQMIKRALKDSVLPQDDRAQSRGRDAQFELLVAAICQHAGLQPVALEEPDVTCVVNGTAFGIAAKRIKNVKKLETRVRQGASQIQRVGCPGVIALDTCVALNRDNKRITTPIPDEQFGPLYKRALDRFIRDHHDGMQEWVRGTGVCGIAVHYQQVRFEPSGEWSLGGMTTWVCTAQGNQRRKRESLAFRNQYFQGLPNVTHLTAR